VERRFQGTLVNFIIHPVLPTTAATTTFSRCNPFRLPQSAGAESLTAEAARIKFRPAYYDAFHTINLKPKKQICGSPLEEIVFPRPFIEPRGSLQFSQKPSIVGQGNTVYILTSYLSLDSKGF
jgi:hypothetical protein